VVAVVTAPSTETAAGPLAGHRWFRSDSIRAAHQGVTVKANLARLTTALVLLASMAMSLGAGMRWFE
jgi:hypothetical protein